MNVYEFLSKIHNNVQCRYVDVVFWDTVAFLGRCSGAEEHTYMRQREREEEVRGQRHDECT